MKRKLFLRLLLISLFVLFFSIPLSANAEMTGTLDLDGSVSGSILVNDANKTIVHTYKITIPEDGKLHFTLKPDGNLYPSLNLLDADMKTSRGSASFKSSTHQTDLVCGGLAAGTYFITVTQGQAYNHETYSGNYVLNDTYEPIGGSVDALNDTKEAAVNASLNTEIIGHIGYEFNKYRDKIDWYALNVTEEGALKIALEASEDLKVKVELLDGDKLVNRGNVVFTHNTSDKKEVTVDGLGKGVYYLCVTLIEPYTSDYYYGLYTIDNYFTPAKYKDNNEPNGSVDSAIAAGHTTEITGNLGYLGNEKRDTADWYYIDTQNDGALSLKLEGTDGLHVYAALLDGDGSKELSSLRYTGSSSDKLKDKIDGLAKGRYYLRLTLIEPYSGDFYFGSYKLSSSFTAAKYIPDKEPNNDRSKAAYLGKSPSGTNNGHVGYYYNGYYDPEDWYKLTITGTSLLIDFERIPAEGIAFRVTDDNGNEIKKEDTGKVKKITLNGLKPGDYFIVVWPLTTHENTRYCGSYSFNYKANSDTATITKITPDPTVLILSKGQKRSVKIKALIAGSTPKLITSGCIFKLANSKIAKIDKSGNVTAVAKGKVKVDVAYGKYKTSFTIIVQ